MVPGAPSVTASDDGRHGSCDQEEFHEFLCAFLRDRYEQTARGLCVPRTRRTLSF